MIKNLEEIATTDTRKRALNIVEAGIERVLPHTLLESSVGYDKENKILTIKDVAYDISSGRVFVIGGGKAVGFMAETLEKILGPENIEAGFVNCTNSDYKTEKIKVIKAGHPIPDQEGVGGVEKMLSLKKQYNINENDFVLCLISGGGSSLMPCPVNEVSLDDKRKLTSLLLISGADIYEINAVRKHLSCSKGGQLGKFFAPARVVSLIISDVIGDDLSTIASGPTVPDLSTFDESYNVLLKHDLLVKTPQNIRHFLRKGIKGEVEETPKTLDNCYNYVIGNNKMALEAMLEEAKELGFKPLVVTVEEQGDPSEIAKLRAKEILRGDYAGFDALLMGGETAPKLPEGPGKGGRIQHYVASSLLPMEEYQGDWLVLGVATDGSDFMPGIAGALIDFRSLDIAEDKKINVKEHLENYDSYNLFKKIGNSLVTTGHTGTNVGDVVVYLLR